jgi:hypothetical protein
MSALVVGRNLEPGACAGRILLEDERNVPPLEPWLLAAGQLGGLQLSSKTQQNRISAADRSSMLSKLRPLRLIDMGTLQDQVI